MKESSLRLRFVFCFLILPLCVAFLIAGESHSNAAALFFPVTAKAESETVGASLTPTLEPTVTPEPIVMPEPTVTTDSTVTSEPTTELAPEPTPEPAPEFTPESTVEPTPYVPARFQNASPLPLEEKQVINSRPATYKQLKKDFEEEAAQGKNLPILCVTTKGNEFVVSRTEYLSCVIDLFNCPEKWVLDELSAGIRVRGNATSFYGDVEKIKENQVPYRIKFDKKTNMLGLNNGARCKNWVLLKCSKKPLNEKFAFEAGRIIMGDHAFCSDSAYIHVYVNDVYQGIYILCEQCQVNKKRVNISEPPAGYTGIDIGYYLTIDNNPKDPFSFMIDYGKHETTDIEGVTRKFVRSAYTVKSDIYTYGQMDFIKNYIESVFEIVYQACENNRFLTLDENFDLVDSTFTSVQETVEAVMDMESVVDMYLLYEMMHDYDVGDGSFYMCIDFAKNSKCPKLQFTSPWDFTWTCSGNTERYWAGAFSDDSFVEQYNDRSNPWFVLLLKQDWFKALACDKWTELAASNAINQCLDELLTFATDNKTEFVDCYPESITSVKANAKWLRNRIAWMNTQFLLSAE